MNEKLTIGFFGSAVNHTEATDTKVKSLVDSLDKNEYIVATGACAGIPYTAASYASSLGFEVHGYSPAIDYENHCRIEAGYDNTIYSKLFYIPHDFPFKDSLDVARKYRNVISTATVDAGIIISGRWGTLHEFSSLYDYGKVIGVLGETGGIADQLPDLLKKINKPSNAKVIFESSPSTLIYAIIDELQRRK